MFKSQQQYNQGYTPYQKKKPNSTVQSMRAGDWVCEGCGNLNFSFRTECNRCQAKHHKTTTKKPLKKLHTRKAFQDVTNLDLQTPPKKELVFKSGSGGFESLILFTPTKDDLYQEMPSRYDLVGKHCERFLEEFEKNQVIEDVSEFQLPEENTTENHQLDQGIAYCIMLLGIDG